MTTAQLIKATKSLKSVETSIENLERKIFLGKGNLDIMEDELMAKFQMLGKLQEAILLF
jgi:hypothetical protein